MPRPFPIGSHTLALAAVLGLVGACASPAAAWNTFQTGETLNRYGWELGVGADLDLGTRRPSLRADLSGDFWMRFRVGPDFDAGFFAHAPTDPFGAFSIKSQFLHREKARMAFDAGLGAGYTSGLYVLARAGLLYTWRFARHFAWTVGGHLLAYHPFAGGLSSSLPLFVGFEIGGDHVSLRPEVAVTPPALGAAKSVHAAFGLSFR